MATPNRIGAPLEKVIQPCGSVKIGVGVGNGFVAVGANAVCVALTAPATFVAC